MTITDGPVAIVTGASRGIGAAIAKLLAVRGYRVAVNYINHESAAHQIVAEISQNGGKALAIQGDMGDERDIVRLFTTADRELGLIEVLVNNAGITGGFARVEDVMSEKLSRLFAVNISGPILCAREAVRRMSTARGGRGGVIVNISSLAARIGSAGEWVAYAASKAAINAFTIGLAREVATDGIRVNAVAPGLIETDLHSDNGDPGRPHRLSGTIPMGRPGSANEVAEAVAWLVSPSASYVTGTVLEVGGGR
jgi:NAD(P)-dependent dehydrogenase (short-subunit alcohol dehydrogenase family)